MTPGARKLTEVHVGVRDLRQFLEVHDEEQVRATLERAQKLRELIGDSTIWNINSTAVGGGVAEMLQSVLAFSRGLGIDTRWLVINGNAEFFQLTKRMHHALHGAAGDGSELGETQRDVYETTLRENAVELLSLVQPGDFVILHDPQPAGLAPELMRRGARVMWRCHIGQENSNEHTEQAWAFLRPYLQDVPAFVFSREAYVPTWCPPDRTAIIFPSIDAFSAKNQDLDENVVRSILVHTGLVEGPMPEEENRRFTRSDGTPGRVERHADVVRLGRAPSWETPLVVQVSRWDPLKDMMGVMFAFAQMLEETPELDADLVLAGPNVKGVADDPEAPQVYEEVLDRWRRLPHAIRDRVHLVLLPTADVEENAAIVNALQRHAAIVVQKSLQEGFGLTVTEAMWKNRAVVASAVGGIQEQIVDGVHGALVQDPNDLDELANTLSTLLQDPERRAELGTAARERVRESFLGIRHLLDYAALIEQMIR